MVRLEREALFAPDLLSAAKCRLGGQAPKRRAMTPSLLGPQWARPEPLRPDRTKASCSPVGRACSIEGTSERRTQWGRGGR